MFKSEASFDPNCELLGGKCHFGSKIGSSVAASYGSLLLYGASWAVDLTLTLRITAALHFSLCRNCNVPNVKCSADTIEFAWFMFW